MSSLKTPCFPLRASPSANAAKLRRAPRRPHLRPARRQRLRTQALAGDSLTGNSLARLNQRLDEAIAREDYAAAAAIRDDLKQLERVSTLGVEEANAAFYRAFQSGDVKAMGEIWGKGEHVQCVHPWAGCIAGHEEVMESWNIVLSGANFDILLKDVRVHASENQGWVTCLEVMDGEDSRGRLIATNVFEKQNGKWVIIHHHASPAPRP
mmetsp:Transcript_27717/g.49490  ORF Transcript_27717/g.49490 Transcript_27717/m.49490 type:complete len:209 (-) Transcript_27717:282-908(-)